MPTRPAKTRPRAKAKAFKKSSPKSSSSTAPSQRPDWICDHVFTETKTVAWQGATRTLQVSYIYPTNTALARSLSMGVKVGWAQCIHPLDKSRVKSHFKSLREQLLPAYIDYRMLDAHGSIHWIRHVVISLANDSEAKGFITDIQTEKEYQLESLRVSDREQNRIGQDLHDDLCQVLAGVSCLMRVAESRIGTKLPDEVSYLSEINQQIVDAMHRTRALTHGLFPGKIQISDIRGALLELAAQLRARFKVEINTRFVGRFPEHSSAQIIQIYRITQEAMSNAIKHGNATHISVTLTASKRNMELTVLDNGSGLAKAGNMSNGVGLHIMSYRAGILGGSVGIANAKPRGVLVTLSYPYHT